MLLSICSQLCNMNLRTQNTNRRNNGVNCYVVTACRPAAELASFWNKPIVSWVATDPLTHLCLHCLTWVATDPEFNDKTVYTTLGRTLGPFNKMGTFLVEVFRQYNWRRVVVISSNFFLWLDAGKAIRKVNRRTCNLVTSSPVDG